MDVSCSSSLPVAGFAWRTRAGQRYATLVCKATYALAVGQSTLAAGQDPLAAPGAADDLRGDRLPFKPRSEVLVVGSAYAPERRPTRRVVARVVVADVDKMIAVVGERVRDGGGRESEPEPFTRMPLVWERAAGGPDTWNPVGLGDHLRDGSGRTALPNVVAIEGSEEVPAGFGPIAPGWAPRAQYAAGRPTRVDVDDAVLEDGVDPRFFQLALPDQQQSRAFDADSRIVLENLHPDHPRFVTNLAPLFAVATLVGDRREQRHQLLADTLWIDTDRARAWLVLRAVIPLADGEVVRAHLEAGLLGDDGVRVEEVDFAAGAARRRPEMPSILDERSIEDARSAVEVAAWSAPPASVPRDAGRHMTREISAVAEAPPDRSEAAALPFRAFAAPALAPPMAPPMAPPLAPPAPPPPAPPPPVPPAATPPSPRAVLAPPPPRVPPPSAPSAPVAPPAPVTPSADRYAVPSAVAAVRPELAHGQTPAPRPVAGSARAAESGVLAASNDAAGGDADPARRDAGAIRAREPRVGAEGARDADRPREPLDLLWFDEALALRDTPELAAVLGGRTRRGVLDAPSDKAEETRMRRDVLRVLSRAPLTSPAQFEAVHVASIDGDGGVRTPLVVVAGEMAVRLDEREALRAAVGVASPFASLDRALKEACELATTVADSEWSGSPQIESASARLREALGRAGRDLGGQRLDATVQRKLLERRRFQRVTLLGAAWLRFDLTAGATVPLYLPDALADRLPLFERLPVRVVAELRRRQDEAESHPDALFVRALARRVGAPGSSHRG